MEQIKANNYDQVSQAFSAHKISDSLSKVPQELRIDEKKYFHLVAITYRVIEGQATNEVVVSILQKHEVDFDKLVKDSNYKYHGIDQLFILHNPKELDDYYDQPKQIVNRVKTEAEIKAEAKAELAAELMAQSGQQNAQILQALQIIAANSGANVGGGTPPNDDEQSGPAGKQDVGGGTPPDDDEQGGPLAKATTIDISGIQSAHPNEIKKFAKENNIDLGEASKKAEMLPIVEAWVADYNAKQ